VGIVHSPQNWQVPVGLASVFLGILVSVQFRVQVNHRTVTSPIDIKTITKTLQDDKDKLQQELKTTREHVAALEKETADHGGIGQKEMARALLDARVRAGLVPLKGPGTIVTLTDSQRRPATDEDPYSFIVHDVDLLSLVNELWAAGAEAVSVNDQRVVNRTAIRCVGPAILVNNVQLASPFMVRAIGPAHDMEGGLRMPGGFLDSMALLIRSGGEVKVTQGKDVVVPAFDGPMNFRVAVPENPTEKVATPLGVSFRPPTRMVFTGCPSVELAAKL
jgi:uncharacterized protein YlxW (UPF0749 family)